MRIRSAWLAGAVLSVVFWVPADLSDHARDIRISLTIPQVVFSTSMWVTPRVLNPASGSGATPVVCHLDLPAPFTAGDLDPLTCRLNGVPLALAAPPAFHPGSPGLTRVHLFFDRAQVIALLGPPPGERLIELEIQTKSRHLITAADTIRVLPR